MLRDTVRLRGEVAMREEGGSSALKWLEQAIGLQGSGHQEAYELAYALYTLACDGQRNFEDVLPLAEQALRTSSPEDTPAIALHLAVLAGLGNGEEVVQQADLLLETWSDPRSLAILAQALRAVGDDDKAREFCEKALAVDPDNIDALCLSSTILLQNGTDQRLALARVEKLRSIDPSEHGESFTDYVASILERKEDERQALEHQCHTLQRAIDEMRLARQPGIPLAIALKWGEGLQIEFKEQWPRNEQLAKAITAFSNSEGGNIYVGVDDKRRVLVGIPEADAEKEKDILNQKVVNVASNDVDPPVSVSVDFVDYEDKVVAWIFVPKGENRPYLFEGRPYFRDGNTSRPVQRRTELDQFYQRAKTGVKQQDDDM